MWFRICYIFTCVCYFLFICDTIFYLKIIKIFFKQSSLSHNKLAHEHNKSNRATFFTDRDLSTNGFEPTGVPWRWIWVVAWRRWPPHLDSSHLFPLQPHPRVGLKRVAKLGCRFSVTTVSGGSSGCARPCYDSRVRWGEVDGGPLCRTRRSMDMSDIPIHLLPSFLFFLCFMTPASGYMLFSS
jgi:hypothetical protein